ncbi:HEAT repeat domain-containing protein [Pirellulaceae bacterium SH449]
MRIPAFSVVKLSILTVSLACSSLNTWGSERTAESEKYLQILRTLEIGDESMVQGAAAAAGLKAASDCQLLDVLNAMKDATPIGKNWLLGVANARYSQTTDSTDKTTLITELERFLADASQDHEARYTVFTWLTAGKPDLRKTLLESMLSDPSPELRYAAVQQALEQSPNSDGLKALLASARHPNQVVEIINRLDKASVKVDQRVHFGFLSDWKFVGPFDHVGSLNFEKAFAVEGDWLKGSLADAYDGKHGEVQWITHSTIAKDGSVDLAALYNKEKGCIVYGITEFESPIEGPAELRMGCINGHRVWLNGELVMSNEVYHSSMQIDQYIEPIMLQKGTNRILVKICQNEQTENWAQRYVFQIRISDSTGLAIPSN